MNTLPRLSLTTAPIMSADITSSTLYYTDGVNPPSSAPVPAAVGAYDVGVNGSTLTFNSFDANRSDPNYVGSINVSVPGQLTCNFSLDYDRKFEVYNALNQRPQLLRVVTQERDLLYCPTNQYNGIGFLPFHKNPLNRGTIVLGNPEVVEVWYFQGGFLDTFNGAYALLNSVGWNGAAVGFTGGGTHDDNNTACGYRMIAAHYEPAAIGPNVATMLVAAAVNSASRQSVIYSANSTGPLDTNGFLVMKWNG